MQYKTEQQKALAEKFLRHLSLERNLSPRTLKAYRSDIFSMFRWISGQDYQVLDSETLVGYFFYLQQDAALAPRSLRRKYASIRQYCEFLSRTCSPGEYFLTFSSRRFQLPKTLPKTLTQGEISALNMEDYRKDDNSVLIHGKGRKERLLFISAPASIPLPRRIFSATASPPSFWTTAPGYGMYRNCSATTAS